MRAMTKSCTRCVRRAKAAGRLTQRALRAITKLKRASTAERWKLSRLRRAIAGERKRLGLGRARWTALVRIVFGTAIDGLVDPRQMSLFDPLETPCLETASPSPSLSRSA